MIVETMPTIKLDRLVVGLNEDRRALIRKLTQGSKELSVIGIVGMPGAGKTTLAKAVYEDQSVRSHFDIHGFVHISPKYESRQLLIAILRDVSGPNDKFDGRSFSDLSEMLYKRLYGKRFIIVMDDVWDAEVWNVLSVSIPKGTATGSRIILTTRSDNVAKDIDVGHGQNNIHHVLPLGREYSWELLEKTIFQEESCPPELKIVGMQIAEQMNGLPLLIVLIAGVLAKSEKTVERWREVLEHTRIVENEAFSIIEMSYQNLPDCVRSCFLYFGALSEDDEIPTVKLIRLWCAEGFIHQTEEKSVEDVAMDYLLILIDRNLIMVTRKSSVDKVKSCRIHDMIQEFCSAKAKYENVYQLMDSYSEVSTLDGFDGGVDSIDSNIPNSMKCEHRRLFISSDWDDYISSRVSGPLVRSLVLTGRSSNISMFPCDVSALSQNFKLLRVLDLACINVGDAFPAGLERMVLLRYLAIRGEMNSIPSSIGRLQQLETFVTIGLSGEIAIPDAIWNLTNLRHLHINDRASFGARENRRKISDKLPNLRTMSTPFLSHGKDSEEILERLASLEKLKCIILESWDSYTQKNMFPRLEFLQNIYSLKLFYYGRVRKTCEFNFPLNLRRLTLSRFCLPWDQISTIGELPNLEFLKLLNKAFEGSLWKAKEEQFRRLKLLKLDALDLEEWRITDDVFPSLERLELQKCKKLKEIPSILGDNPTLKVIEVKWCSQSVEDSALSIQEEQEYMGNDWLKVFIHKTEDRAASEN